MNTSVRKVATNRKIYLGGKIKHTDWRHTLGDFRGNANSYPEEQRALTDQILPLYLHGWEATGPFFMSCDHGCFHGDARHGLGLDGEEGGCATESAPTFKRSTAVYMIEKWIRRADLFFCWLESDADEAYGTIFEAGFAKGLGIPVLIGLGPTFTYHASRELWIMLAMADRVVEGSDPATVISKYGPDVIREKISLQSLLKT